MSFDANTRNKRQAISLVDSSSDEESMKIEPPRKKRKRNTNHNQQASPADRWSAARNSDHYRKYVNTITAYNSVDFNRLMRRRDNNDDDDHHPLHSQSPSSSSSTISKAQLIELKEKLRILARIATFNQSPSYDLLTIDKSKGVHGSKGMALLKHKVVSNFAKNKLKVILKDSADDIYQSMIRLFVLKNKNIVDHTNNAENPWIAIKRLNESARKKNDFEWKNQRQILKLYDGNEGDYNSNHSIDQWVDNMELIATEHIMAHTVIGEYYGLLLTVKEFDDVYGSSSQCSLANLYCFEETLRESVLRDIDTVQVIDDSDDSDDRNEQSSKVKQEEHSNEEKEDEMEDDVLGRTMEDIQKNGNKFIIDAIGYQTRLQRDHLLVYVVPCEREDDDRINVKFVTAEINEWPRIFIVTTREIERNEPICGYFGETFKLAKYQQNKEKMRRARIKLKVHEILQMNLFMKEQ